MMETVIIDSLSQYISEISSIDLKYEHPLSPVKLLFRGLSKFSYELVPALGRYPSQHVLNSWQLIEQDLVQTAQQKYPLLFSDTDYPTIRLAKLQHYGIPTRMLDLTENALVALFFSCNQEPETNGEVVAFPGPMCSAYNPVANIIADTYRLIDNATTGITTYRYRALQQPYSVELLSPDWENCTQEDLKYFVNLISEPLFIEVGEVCERQKNQSGNFLLFPNRIDETKQLIEDDLIDLKKTDPRIVKQITIPWEYKTILLSQLERFGITKEFLFSDDVDKVCECVVNKQRERLLPTSHIL